MKKAIYLFVFFLILLCGCHTHNYEETWFYDELNHYHRAICCEGEIIDLESHQFIEEIITEPTHDKKGEAVYTCSICDYIKEEEIEMIEHKFSEEYYYNRTKHYYLCECGEKKDSEEHDYSNEEIVVEATQFTDGLKKYTCKCGSEKEEVIKVNDYIIDTEKEEIYLITTSAGTDISNSVGISWHSSKSGSYLMYLKEGTTEVIELKPNEEYWSIEESYMSDPYQNKRYVCTVDLTNLDSNTKYYYKIISGDVSSNVYTFKTANDSNKYTFLSFVDFQYSENKNTLSLVKFFTQKTPDANLITCSGDITDEGYREQSHRYLFDSDVVSNSILAFGTGDHEYWGTDTSPIKMMQRPYSYNKLFNNPDNGCEGYLNSSYYFKYNTTLFVFLDCGDSNVSSSNDIFTKQANWLDNVLSTEKGYDFIIVCMHKSLYGDPKQDSTVRKFAPKFTTIFDKHKVDLVISGHDHEYSRTKAINNGEVVLTGTVYLDLGNSGAKTRATGDEIKTSNLYAKYIDIKEKNYALGIVGKVEDDKLIIEVRTQAYTLVDEVTIEKKIR